MEKPAKKSKSRIAGSFGARPCRELRKRLFENGIESWPKSWRRSWIIARVRNTPLWADFVKIRNIYREAQRLSDETGVPHEVDHPIPLQGERVSGLHCEFNLRVVPRKINNAKSNIYHIDQAVLIFSEEHES